MSKNPTTTTVEETPAPEETVPSFGTTITVIAPNGEVAHVGEDLKSVRQWCNEHPLGKKERYLLQTEGLSLYKPRSPKDPNAPKLTKEQRAAAKAERMAARKAKVAANKEQRIKDREAKKAAREAERAAKKAAREAAKDKVVTTKGGARVVVKQPTATTQQLQALARARQKVAEAKAAAKTVKGKK